MDNPEEPEAEEELLVVVAHSLLGPVLACRTAAQMLLERHEILPADLREELLRHLALRARFTCDLLGDLIRGGSDALVDALAELDASRPS